MGFLSGAIKFVKNVGTAIVDGVVKTAEVTLKGCESIARATADGCKKLAEKIRKWWPAKEPHENVPQDVKEMYVPIASNSIKEIKNDFPMGVKNAATKMQSDERLRKLEEHSTKAAGILGVKNQPKVEMFVPQTEEEMYLCGGYRYSDNVLRLNAAWVVADNPELFAEQVSTVYHEMVHARQHEAVRAWANNESVVEYGYTEEYVERLAYNMNNYIRPEEDPEAYTKQPLEAEAFYFESQIKPHYN